MSKHSFLFSLALSLLSALSLGSCADIDSADVKKDNGNGRILKIMAKVSKPQTTRVSSNESWSYNYEDSTYTQWQEFQWDSGDEIALIGPDGSVATYRTENGDGTFTAIDGGLHMADGQIRAVYPASGSVGGNNQQCFIGDTWVSEGQEQADITFNPLLSKVNIRTYTEDGSYPVDIQPILYGISSEGYFDINSFTLSSGWPDSIKFENPNTFVPQYGYQPLKKKDCKIYTSYESLVVPNSGDYWNNGNSCRLKYSLYGIFDIEKTIPEKLQAGTEYDIMLKVPKEPTVEIEDYRNKIVTIKMPIPHGFSMDNINRDDYEVKISNNAGNIYSESWKMSLPETITDSVLSFTVSPKQLYTTANTGDLFMYSISINKKNHETGDMEEVFLLGSIGSHAKQMEGIWQGTESWKDWEDETDHTKTYNRISFRTQYQTETRIWGGPFHREGTQIWMFGNEVEIVYWRPEDGDNKLYILSGTVDNPAYPTSFQGTFLRGDTQTWQVDYSHEFNMKRTGN